MRTALAGQPSAPGAARTPLMRQYLGVKDEYPEAFVFFRLGDFYEMFFEDATRGAGLLGLTLTSRNKHDPQPIPMCGIPWHQRDAYVGRLLRLGHKVAICDQLEEAGPGKGLVERGVTEVLTPGSVMGDHFLEPGANNYLAALWPTERTLAVCFADASTAEVRIAEPAWDDAAATLARAPVTEWLVPEGGVLPEALAARLERVQSGLGGARSVSPRGAELDRERLERRWPDHAAALQLRPAAGAACAMALAYLDRVQGGPALPRPRIEYWDAAGSLRVDAATARHLELFEAQPGGDRQHTLWHHLDLAVSAPGSRRLRGWLERPLADLPRITHRQRAVESWLRPDAGRSGFREALRGLPDLERLAARLACGRATPRDLGALRDALARLPAIAAALAPRAEAAALAVPPGLDDLLRRALADEPPPMTREGGIIREGWDELRDELHSLAHSGKRWIAELEMAERARTGIGSLKIGYNRVFGYFLEVTRAHLEKVPPDYERRQTLTGAERFVTPALKVKETEVLSAEERLKAREHDLFVRLRADAAEHIEALLRASEGLAALDAEAALAEAASRYAWVRPTLDESDRLEIDGLRHPVVERMLPRGEFVPNDVRLTGTERQILLLTGPNMGGKSTYLRQTALAVLLAQSGSYVPAAAARIGLVDRLFTRVGAADRLGAGQCTFMVEMTETADILRSATPRSLVLLDEIGRGTSTYDGLALAWAVTEFLHHSNGPRPRTMFATHYHELTQLAGRLSRLSNVQVAVREHGDQVVFLHRIVEGAADRSYGIHVAQMAGLPPRVIARAREVLAELEAERTVDVLGTGEPAGPHRAEDARDGATRRAPQADLFDSPHPLLAELAALDLERLTPLDALNRLNAWKARWGA